MSVTEELMRLGQWDLSLVPNTPDSIRQLVTFDDTATGGSPLQLSPQMVVITPTPLMSAATTTDANVLSLARYTGVVTGFTKSASSFSLSGRSLLWLWGNASGFGPFPWYPGTPPAGWVNKVSWTTNGSVTISAFLDTALGAGMRLEGNFLTKGTVNLSGVSNINTQGPEAGSWRELWDALCAQAGCEYRVNPTGAVDIATAANLFVSTPTVLVAPGVSGYSGTIRGVSGNMETTSDIESLVTDVVVRDVGGGLSAAISSRSMATVPSKIATMAQHATSDLTGVGTTTAANLLALNTNPRVTVTLGEVTEYQVGRFANVGDYVYLYDPSAGVVDATNQIVWNGRPMYPVKYRLRSMTWPIESGMGVYLRNFSYTGGVTYTDLTPWVSWEPGADAFGFNAPDASDSSKWFEDRPINGPATAGAGADRGAMVGPSGLQPAVRGGNPPPSSGSGSQGANRMGTAGPTAAPPPDGGGLSTAIRGG